VPNLRFLTGSAESLPFAPAAFDLVTAFEVIEHVPNWARALDELARVLAPEGVAVISTPNRDYYTQSRGSAGPNPFHVHEFDYTEFRDELSRRFPSVSVLLQSWTQCLAFYPHRIFPPADCSVESSAGEAEQAHFFVAICSHAARPDRVRSYVHVPRAANVLREREIHIAALESELRRVRDELATLLRAHDDLHAHLENQNNWAQSLDSELGNLRRAHGDLQSALEEKTRWALSTVSELDELRRLHADLNRELEEHNAWALGMSAELETARRSKWVRLGRRLGLGPKL
jgi:SAM-dependent methyltransferase